jgi:peptide deformylase
MTIRKILKMGDPRLLRTAQLVPAEMLGSLELKQLIEDMVDTMHANDGVGLAAPQIGVDLQLVIFGFEQNERYPDKLAVPQTVLINPVITPLGAEQEDGWEGCLSLPGLRGVVPRYKRICYEGVDPEGVPILREVDDFHARMVQHECDHLSGTLYPMRIQDFAHFGFSDALFPEQAQAESIPIE